MKTEKISIKVQKLNWYVSNYALSFTGNPLSNLIVKVCKIISINKNMLLTKKLIESKSYNLFSSNAIIIGTQSNK
jgi:hypothetical protein